MSQRPENPAEGIYTIDSFLQHEEIAEFREMIQTPPAEADQFTANGLFNNFKVIDQGLATRFYERLIASGLTADRGHSFLRANHYVMAGHYRPGDQFSLHTDTGLFYDRKRGEKSRWTLLIYLNDNFDGGQTTFFTDTGKEVVRIQPRAGRALLFDIDLWHRGEEVRGGEKMWIGCEIIGVI
jgi:prolyl 4-hydroxylase